MTQARDGGYRFPPGAKPDAPLVDADTHTAEDDFNRDLFMTSLFSRKLRGSSAEAESTYHSSVEAETVVAEAAQKTARKPGRFRRE